jgi:hypothetical protein
VSRFLKNYRFSVAGTAIFFLLLVVPVAKIPGEITILANYGIDKIAHSLLFFTLTTIQLTENRREFLNYGSKLKISVFVIWGILFACITELFQEFFTPGRQGSLYDILADATGSLIAFLVFKSLRKKFFIKTGRTGNKNV